MELKRQCGGRGPGGGTGARSGWPGLSAEARGFVAGREPGCVCGGVDEVGGGPQPGCSTPQASPLSAGSAVLSLSPALTPFLLSLLSQIMSLPL